jgi:hypothetical protein
LALGIPPNELDLRIPHRQLVEWAAFEHVDGPILLHDRIDFMAALVSFVTAKSHGAQRIRLKDFFPRWGGEPEQDPETLRQIMEGLASQPSQPSSSTS